MADLKEIKRKLSILRITISDAMACIEDENTSSLKWQIDLICGMAEDLKEMAE